jgi:hypothetical protein
MPYAKVNKSVGGLDTMAKTIAVPRDYKANRIPTFPALERTGVLSFTDTKTVTISAEGSTAAMVCRDPGFPVWTQHAPNNGTTFSVFTLLTGLNDFITTVTTEGTAIPVGPMVNFYTNSASTFATTAGAYSYPILVYQGERFFHNTTGQIALEINCSLAPGVTSLEYTVVLIDANFDRTMFYQRSICTVTGNNVGCRFALPAGSVGFRLESLSIITTISIQTLSCAYGVTTETVSTATPLSAPTGNPAPVLFPITKAVEAATTTIPWKSTRATAVGALFSNVTAVLNKEGTVKSARVSVEQVNILDSSAYDLAIDTVYPKDRYFGAMENGLYTFTLPDSGAELYRDCLFPTNSALISPALVGSTNCKVGIFDLDKLGYANIILFTDINVGDTTLAVTIDRHIEFRSSSVLFPLGYSNLQLETYHNAQMALVQLGVFFENPLHMGLIAAAVGQAIRSVASYAYPIVREVGKSAIAAAGDKLLSMANRKLGAMTQAHMIKQPAQNQRKPKPKTVVKKRVVVRRK